MKSHRILIVLVVVVVGGIFYLQHGGLEHLEALRSSLDAPDSPRAGSEPGSAPSQASAQPEGWVQAATNHGIVVRQRPDADSLRLDMLLPHSVVSHYGSNGRGWLRMKTFQGQTGWIPESEMMVIGADQAKRTRDRDRLALERHIRSVIKQAVGEKAKLKHPRSHVIDYKIMSELKPHDEFLCSIEACTLMKGSILGLNEYRTDYRVTLNLSLNPYKLDATEVHILEVDITRDQMTDGLPPGEVVNILAPLAARLAGL